MISYLALAFTFGLALIHLMSKHYHRKIEPYKFHLLSFSSGIFISYIFLIVFPEIFIGVSLYGHNILVSMLSGFVLFHLLEKYTYQHAKTKRRLLDKIAHLHVLGFFLDSFIVGFTLVFLWDFAPIYGWKAAIPFIPFFFHSLASSLTLQNIDDKLLASNVSKYVLSFSVFLGALCATLFTFSTSHFYIIFSFLMGVLLYIVIRDTIPKGDKGKPVLFVIGIIITLIHLWLSNI